MISTRLMARREAVSGDLIVERSALRMLLDVRIRRKLVLMNNLRKHIGQNG